MIKTMATVTMAVTTVLIWGCGGSDEDAGAVIAQGCNESRVSAALKATAGVELASVTEVPASGVLPNYCSVSGSSKTTGEGGPDGLAKFGLYLPAASGWNGKFLFAGNAGFDGNVVHPSADNLGRGYAVVATDAGHAARGDFPLAVRDFTFAVKAEGQRNDAAVVDYYC